MDSEDRQIFSDYIVKHFERQQWDKSMFDESTLRDFIHYVPVNVLKDYFDILIDRKACGEDDE